MRNGKVNLNGAGRNEGETDPRACVIQGEAIYHARRGKTVKCAEAYRHFNCKTF
jgi:hypothetical protein